MFTGNAWEDKSAIAQGRHSSAQHSTLKSRPCRVRKQRMTRKQMFGRAFVRPLFVTKHILSTPRGCPHLSLCLLLRRSCDLQACRVDPGQAMQSTELWFQWFHSDDTLRQSHGEHRGSNWTAVQMACHADVPSNFAESRGANKSFKFPAARASSI